MVFGASSRSALRWPPLLCACAAALVAAAAADATTASAPPVSPACVVSVGAQSFDLAELGSPAVYHRSQALDSKGWSYFFSACGDVPLRSLGEKCGSAPRSAALQETQVACYSLGAFATRDVSATASGVSIAFSGGDDGRSTVLAVDCADIPRRLVLGWKHGDLPKTYVAHVRARAGCSLTCARDPVTGAVCGGAQRGTCVISVTPDHTASCTCRSGYAGPLCLREPPKSPPMILGFSDAHLLPAVLPTHALSAAAIIGFICARCTWPERAGCACGTRSVQRASLIFTLFIGVFALTVVQRPPARIISASASPHQPAIHSLRWRGNNYIRDDGVLPYQLCSADQGFPGPRRSAATFSQGGRSYRAVLTAASVWGESLPSGQPLRVDALELLVYFSEADQPCNIAMYVHCAISSLQPAIACRFRGTSSWRNGTLSSGMYVAVVRCPLDLNSSLPDASDVEIALGDRAVTLLQTATSLAEESSNKGGIFSASICYEHVAAMDDLVICTTPHFFDERSSFWRGSPPYIGESTLLEAFLFHTLNVVNASRLAMHDLGTGLYARMKPFLAADSRIKYRKEWALHDELPGVPGVGTELNLYAFEAHAHATCGWEHRIRARWVQILHAVDNFLMPLCFGCNVSSVLARVNYTAFSELRVPMVEANTPGLQSAEFRTQNVLQRFSLLAEDWVGRGRETPIGNPRHFNEALIHEFSFPRFSGLKIMEDAECMELGLLTVHIMALARPQLDTHDGLPDKTYSELGFRLAAELSEWERKIGEG